LVLEEEDDIGPYHHLANIKQSGTDTSMKRRKTALKSIRIPKDLLAILEEDSIDRGISFNSLVSSLLTKYVEWERYTMTSSFFHMLLEATDASKLKQLTLERQNEILYDIMLFWFHEISPLSFINALMLIGKYTNLFRIEVTYSTSSCTTIVIKHGHGQRYSEHLEYHLGEVIRRHFKVTPEITNTSSLKLAI
jgi:hypothetical protein